MRWFIGIVAVALAAAVSWAAGDEAIPQAPRGGAADARRGALLYDTACGACHTTQAHWRDKHLVRSWAELLYQVETWQRVAGQGWGRSEIEDVAAHLNRHFYRLPCPAAGCAGPEG